MGDVLSSVLGTNSQYNPSSGGQAGNPFINQLGYEIQNEGNINTQQQQLANQLLAQQAGQGPNPAQLQYQQNVGNNINQAQGLIQSQRGLNPALAAKMGSDASTNANMQAAGQQALMQQQQQLGATQNLGNLYGQMQQGNLGQQGLYNQANSGAMQTNAAVANANQQQAGKIVGGILGAAGSVVGMAHGGRVPNHYDGGGFVNSDPTQGSAPKSKAGGFLSGYNADSGSQSGVLTQGFGALGAMGGSNGLGEDMGSLGKGLGSKIGGIFSSKPSEATSPAIDPYTQNAMDNASDPYAAQAIGLHPEGFARGGQARKSFKPGGKVPGSAPVKGDSLKNDNVKAMLSPGEIVIPRSIVHSGDAPKKAAQFVAAIMARDNMKRKK